MSLWGMKDKIGASPGSVVVTAANSTVIGTSTTLTAFKVGDFLNVGGNDYVFTAIANATVATVRSADNGGTLAGASANANYVVSEKPKSITYSESGGDASLVFGADTTEVGVAGEGKRIAHAGWVKRTAGSGGRSGRIHYETLVAAGSISGDAADDTQLPDA